MIIDELLPPVVAGAEELWLGENVGNEDDARDEGDVRDEDDAEDEDDAGKDAGEDDTHVVVAASLEQGVVG